MPNLDGGAHMKKRRMEEQSPEVSRSIAACQRCRAKKIKCDRNFPQCSKCTKAGLDCVGIDPATGREVPRSYVFHLEQRVRALEYQLEINGINTPVVEKNGLECSPQFGISDSYDMASSTSQTNLDTRSESAILSSSSHHLPHSTSSTAIPLAATSHGNNSENNYLGASSGITFAKLMMAAVKFKESKDSSHALSSINTSSDSRSAVLPPKSTAQNFIRIYFNQSNTQLPILHREVFLKTIFEPIYGSWDPEIHLPSTNRTPSEAHMRQDQSWIYQYKQILSEYNAKLESRSDGAEVQSDSEILQTISNSIEVPKKFQRPLYYLNLIFAIASSSNHLQYMNSISEQFRNAAMKFIGSISENSDPMEELQSSLLLTLYSLMRPCVDGVWYILGKCLRICVDLGLHNKLSERTHNLEAYIKDKKRRLFWCTYSLDRQVCFYLGRPVGIPESSIDIKFPSILEDSLINEQNTLDPALADTELYHLRSANAMDAFEAKMKLDTFRNFDTTEEQEVQRLIKVNDYSDFIEKSPSYKVISRAFFRIRQIQSEVQRILYEDEDLPRRFNDVRQWKTYIMGKLRHWLASLPRPGSIANCDFHFEFFLLNYNHTLLMINGLSPKSLKLTQEEFQIVAVSSRNIMGCYTELYVKRSINYTWAAVHNLFMAGTSFLFVLYHSDEIRQQYDMQLVMKITGHCISILSSLIASCDAAKSCSETFQVLTAAVLKLRYNVDVDANYDNSNNGKSPKPSPDNTRKYSDAETDGGFESLNEKNASTIDPRNAFGSIGASYNGGTEDLEKPQQYTSATHVKQEFEISTHAPNSLSGSAGDADIHATDTEPMKQALNDFVPQFEWISRKSSEVSDMLENSIYANGKNLETFFSEVANLSPISSVREYSYEQNGAHAAAWAEGASGSRIPQREAKKVFELIQQVPTESIWDQFFTKPQGSKNQDNPANL